MKKFFISIALFAFVTALSVQATTINYTLNTENVYNDDDPKKKDAGSTETANKAGCEDKKETSCADKKEASCSDKKEASCADKKESCCSKSKSAESASAADPK
jgi:hypothetical protein